MRKALLTAIFSVTAMLSASVFAQDEPRLNRAIETLENGDPAFGIFTGNFSLANARGLARSGLDYIFIDMEHSAFNVETLQEFLLGMTDKAAIANNGHLQMATTPIVRIPQNGRENLQWQIKQVLDMGVFGVMVPYVETAEDALEVVKAVRYPQPRGADHPEPEGQRGSGAGIASWYWGAPNYTQVADTWPLNPEGEVLVVLQIESEMAVENAREIMSVPGVGAIFIGPADLAMSMGLPGQSGHPEVEANIQRVLEICLELDMPCGLTTNAGNIAERIEQGFRFPTVGYWGDAGIGGGTAEALRRAREASGRD